MSSQKVTSKKRETVEEKETLRGCRLMMMNSNVDYSYVDYSYGKGKKRIWYGNYLHFFIPSIFVVERGIDIEEGKNVCYIFVTLVTTIVS